MLDKQDIAVLEGMFIRHTVSFKEIIKQNNVDLKRDIRDEVHSLIAASEHRMRIWMTSKLESLKTEIVSGVIDVVDGGVLPQIDDLRTDMIMIKGHLKLA